MGLFKKKKKEIIKDSQYYQRLVECIQDKLDGSVRYSLNVDEYDEAAKQLEEWKINHMSSTFQEELFDRMNQKKLISVDFYKRAHMDRKLFSTINCNRDYAPKRDTAIKCCFALRLEVDETQELLKKAGYALSNSTRRDVLLKHCIESGIYDLDDVNYLLNHFEESTL